MLERSTHGTCKLNTERLENLAIPLPTLAEQRRIVERVDQLMALCDDLEAKLREERAAAERLAEALCRELAGDAHGDGPAANRKLPVGSPAEPMRQARMALE